MQKNLVLFDIVLLFIVKCVKEYMEYEQAK